MAAKKRKKAAKLNPVQRVARGQARKGVRAGQRGLINVTKKRSSRVNKAIRAAGGGGGIQLPGRSGPGSDTSR